MWMLFGISAVVVVSVSSALDPFLANHRFKNGLALALFSAVMNIVFLPFIFWIDPPGIPPLSLLPFFITASLLDILFLIPYYKAMQEEDTSVVAALFSLTRIFTPIFAYFLLAERLTTQHYIGFALITVSGLALSMESLRRLRFNKAFWLMVVCSLMVSLDSVLYKYQLERVSWGTSMVWGSLFTVPWLIAITLLIPTIRRQMTAAWPVFQRSWGVLTINEFFTFAAGSLGMYALFLAPVTQSSSIWGLQPFVILVFASALKKLRIKGVIEDTSRGSLLKKAVLFTVMLAGVFLIKD